MSPLLTLVKILTSLYQASKLDDKVLTGEITETYDNLVIETSSLFPEDKKTESGIRQTIDWVKEQPTTEPIIKSNLIQRVNDFIKDAPELKESINVGLEDYPSEERTRQIIYKHLEEIKKAKDDDEFDKKFRAMAKDFYFNNSNKIDKDKWVKLAELIETKINSVFEVDQEKEVIETVDTDNEDSFIGIINRAKTEKSEEGIIKTGLQGLNKALYPDNGFRRAKFYLINALTNRGKSFGLGHIVASVGLYNKPMLRNKSKIPTIVLDSAEDSLDIIIERMYKLIVANKHDIETPDFANTPSDQIASVIADAFKANGWCLKINQIIPSEDNATKMMTRIRKLELAGHEVIFWAYDYLAMADLKGCSGETKGDKLQDLYRRIRVFIVSRGICYCTPHQLSPQAKQMLRESDDDAELNFAKEVGGKSLTETSTKITNEADVEMTFHVAKTGNDKAYFTCFVGKQRGEGADISDRFFVYNLDPKSGLKHDYGKKPQFRKSFKHVLDENGENKEDWDFATAA